jgi:hypothetical protein
MRRPFRILGIVLGLAVLFYGAVWLWAWSRLESQIDRAIAEHEEAGGEFSAAELTVGGFPFSLGAVAEELVLVQPDGVTWRTPRLTARSRLWSLDRIDLTAEEGLEMAAPTTLGATPLAATSRRAGGEIDHDFGRTAPVMRLRLEDVLIEPPVGEAARADRVALTVVGADPEAGPEGEMAIGVDAAMVSLPHAARIGLDQRIDEVGVTLALVGPPPPALQEPALALWQQAGGLIRVDRLHLLWGELGLSGEGTLRLDDSLQPVVRLETEVRGLSQALAGLTQSGTLSLGAAAAIGLGFGMLGGGGQDGGTPLTIEVADRRVTVGSAALPGRLPPIDWPDGPAIN